MLISIFNWYFQMCKNQPTTSSYGKKQPPTSSWGKNQPTTSSYGIGFNPGRVKQLLKQRSLKIIDVAKQLKISPSYLSRKLRGERHFRPEELASLAKILEVEVQDFFLGNDG